MAEENLIFYNLRSCAKSHSYVKIGTKFSKMTENVWDGKDNSGIISMSEWLDTYRREVRKDWQNAYEVVIVTENVYS